MSDQRFHSLDALRAFALLLGVALHAAMSFVVPPGHWVVGTAKADTVPALFVYYVHSFRMETFFLLAGFFGRLVVGRRGLAAYLRDRGIRIVLVFAVLLYPMKFALTAMWITGGRQTGWLQLPPAAADLPWWRLALGTLARETLPAINLTHLWFLYYLAIIIGLFVAARALARRLVRTDGAADRFIQAAFRRVGGSWLAPLALLVPVVPLLASMRGFDIDTPDKTLAWHWPSLALYGLFFVVGWQLHRHADLLAAWGRRGAVWLPLSLVVGLVAATMLAARIAGKPWAVEHAAQMRWLTATGTGLTMCLAVGGWVGLFVRVFDRPRPWVRYLADSSYWIYLAHLPIVVPLQVGLAGWPVAWWIKWPVINLVAFPVLLLSYQLGVRRTWIGAWLNGRRAAPAG